MQILADHRIADITARYISNSAGRVGLILFPTSMRDSLATRRDTLRGEPFIDSLPDAASPPAIDVDSLVHLKLIGDPYPGAFAQGRTLRDGPSVDRFQFESQTVENDGDRTVVVTRLITTEKLWLTHRLSWRAGDRAVEITTSFTNNSQEPVTLEMLTSFSLGGITPFDRADATGRLQVHRFRSVWSAEGRLQTDSIERLHLERSWSGSGLFSERFGQLGTMPVRGWFPFVAAEDTVAGVTWAAQIGWAGSWQMEISRRHDDLCLSGGLADREFGHWMKTVAVGETLVAPSTYVTCVSGSLDDACDRLTALQNRTVDTQPKVEQSLPIVFNEWCTTWGDPQHDRVVAIADRLRNTRVTYLVIDAGWYKPDGADWNSSHGDWVPNPRLFPAGLAAAAAAIRERGLIPGLWFEMETVGETSAAFDLVDLLMKRDGIPITVRGRRFWDFNNDRAIAYLAERVIGTLKTGGFGYLKVDYNETAGLGCDGFESQGEGLRLHVLGIYRFFDRIRAELPELVIENCSSGGHRLEPSMLARTAMSSFSDAHELPEIPIIAANLHRLILPRQSQIWAVLHAADNDRRLDYSLAATFLGRMCLSGEIDRLTNRQWARVEKAMGFYRSAASIIRDGTSRHLGETGSSWRHPTGWQAVIRTAANRNSLLCVIHTFDNAPAQLHVPLPDGKWAVNDTFGNVNNLDTSDAGFNLTAVTSFSAYAALFTRTN